MLLLGDRHIVQEMRDNPEDYIPDGPYCHKLSSEGRCSDLCPFWDRDDEKPAQMNGYCHLLLLGDWMGERGTEFLWEQLKECCINDNEACDYYQDELY